MNGLLCPCQFGFRQGRSTQQAVTLLSENIGQNIDKGLCSGAVYIDLRKAFDTVSHATLLEKLPSYGMNYVVLKWVADYLCSYPLQLSLLPRNSKQAAVYTNRAAKIVNPKAKKTSLDSIEKIRNTRVAIDVFKSLHNLIPEDLNAHFKRCEHEINTRGNGSCVVVVLPKMRTETGKKSFAYQGAHIFNRLEKTTRDEIFIVLFKEKLKLSKSL